MRKLWLAVGLLAALPGCGPSIPTRFVLERDVDGWAYRRYQRVLDVELAIEGNPAVGHTATYVRRASRTSDQVPFANVFVSVYERPEGLAAVPAGQEEAVIESAEECPGECIFIEAD